eukprot:06876.XXX_434995_434316_1 [CDS] Oithona nana genome sequencing.
MLLQTELDFDLETNSVAQKKSLFGSGGGSSLTPTVVVLTSHKKTGGNSFETKRKQHRERSNGKKPSFSRIVAGKAALVLRHEGASSEATHGLQPTLEGSTD